jgi:hypothetical protein
MSKLYQSLSHPKWDCKYHVVFVPKYRHKVMYREIGKCLGPIFHELARQKECRLRVCRTQITKSLEDPFRLKTIFGATLRRREFDNQAVEFV